MYLIIDVNVCIIITLVAVVCMSLLSVCLYVF